MSVAEVTPDNDGGCKLVGDNKGNELRTHFNLYHMIYAPNDGNIFATCVVDLRCIIEFGSIISHRLSSLIERCNRRAVSSIKDDNNTFG